MTPPKTRTIMMPVLGGGLATRSADGEGEKNRKHHRSAAAGRAPGRMRKPAAAAAPVRRGRRATLGAAGA
jgi:hypothetical protein